MRGFLRRRPNIRVWVSSRVARASRWVVDNVLVGLGKWLRPRIMGVVDGKLQRPILVLVMGAIVGLYMSGMALIAAAHVTARAGAFAAFKMSLLQLYCAYYLHHFAIILAAHARKLGEFVRFREIYEEYWY